MGLLDILSDFPGSNPNALYSGALNDEAFRRELGMRQLAAMAGAFGRAAMPTRMPIPIGAVLGTAGEAAGSAGDEVMKARLQNAQANQAQQYADIYKNLPGLLAKMPGMPGSATAGGSDGGDALPTMGGGTTGAGGMGTGQTGDFLQPAIDEMRKAGWSDAAIQAALGHGLAEGGFKTNWNTGDSGSSHGHWQFHAGGELPGYLKFAQANGLDPSDTRAQTRYMMQRMEQISPGFGKLTDPRAAMDIMGTKFERYAGNGPGQRGTYLAQAGTLLGGGGAGGATPPGSLSLPEVPSYGADLTRSRSLPTLAAPAAGGADDAQLRADYDASIARFQRGGKERAKPETFEQYKARMAGGESTGSSTDPMAGMTAADAGGGGDDGGGMGTGLNLGGANAAPALPTLSPELRAPLPAAPAAAAAPAATPSAPGAPTVPGATFTPPQMQMPKVPGLSPQQQQLFNQLLIYSGVPGLSGLGEVVKSNPAYIGAQEAAKRGAGLPFDFATELNKKNIEIAGIGPIEAAKLPFDLARKVFETNEQIRAAGPVAAAQNFERMRAEKAADGIILTKDANGNISVSLNPEAVKAANEAAAARERATKGAPPGQVFQNPQTGGYELPNPNYVPRVDTRPGPSFGREVQVPNYPPGVTPPAAPGATSTPPAGPTAADLPTKLSPGEIQQQQTLGTKGGEAFAQEQIGAEEAQQSMRTNQRARELVDKAIVGFGSSTRLELGRALVAAGFSSYAEPVQATQEFLANQIEGASRVLHRYGSGSGITDRDFTNALAQVGGSPDKEKAAIKKILDMVDQVNTWAIQKQHAGYDRVQPNDPYFYKVPIPIFPGQDLSGFKKGTPVVRPDGAVRIVGQD